MWVKLGCKCMCTGKFCFYSGWNQCWNWNKDIACKVWHLCNKVIYLCIACPHSSPICQRASLLWTYSVRLCTRLHWIRTNQKVNSHIEFNFRVWQPCHVGHYFLHKSAAGVPALLRVYSFSQSPQPAIYQELNEHHDTQCGRPLIQPHDSSQREIYYI